MRRFMMLSGCFFLVYMGWCLGKAQVPQHLPGGGDWKTVSQTNKQFYLIGFVQGYRQGFLHAGSLGTATYAPKSVSSMTPTEKSDLAEAVGLARRVEPYLIHRPFTGLEASWSTFYSDPRNTPVCWDKAILFSVAALAGSPATEQELAKARKQGPASCGR
jgi:hypothetical protein